MKRFTQLAVIVIVIVLAACSQSDKKKIVNTDKNGRLTFSTDYLPQQAFTINPLKDTTIITQEGIRFFIPKESFTTNAGSVLINIQEALRLSDMLKAGLAARSNGSLLQSGGMFNITATANGQSVQLQKRIGVKVPTNQYRKDMLLYKGEKNDSTINWTDPKPLLSEEEQIIAISGEKLYQTNCTNCHKIDKDFIGPALGHVTERRCMSWIKGFTNHSFKMDDPISFDVKKRYNNAAMTQFNFSDAELDSLYVYIAAESKKLPPFTGQRHTGEVVTLDTVAINEVLVNDTINSAGFGKNNQPDLPVAPRTATGDTRPPVNTPPPPAPQFPANEYYDFTIENLGWHNIDYLLEGSPGTVDGSLIIQIDGDFEKAVTVWLVIPGRKVLSSAYTNDNHSFFIKTPDYELPVALGEPALLFAMVEKGEQAYLAKQFFYFGQSQTIKLQPIQVKDIAAEIDKLQVDKLEYSVRFKRKEKRYTIVEQIYQYSCGADSLKTRPMPGTAIPEVPQMVSSNK